MLYICRIFFVSLLATFVAGSALARVNVPGIITKVVDGDTVKFQPDDHSISAKPMSIRMVLIDTPETKLPGPGGPHSQGYWGLAATDYLKSLVSVGDRVEIESFGIDLLYYRMVGKVWKNGIDINLQMLKSGWASLYVYCNGVDPCYSEPEYLEACNSAQSGGLGIFEPANPLPELPFVFRSRAQRVPIIEYVGHRTERFYVEPDRWAEIPLCDRVFITTPDVAHEEGFSIAN